MRPSLSPSARRGLNLVLAVASAAALVGFFTGTRRAPIPLGYREPSASAVSDVPRAPRQRDVAATRYAARRAEQQRALQAMAAPPRELSAPVGLDPAAYERDVTERARGRAYDGAPPTIPHAVDQMRAPACLSCHEHGLNVEGKIARPVSHASYSNCLQCHATREASVPLQQPLAASVAEANSFVGLASPGRGLRAWSVAPPQMPHRSFMRERCASCHGVWATGIASTHPGRQNCLQCHTPAASADQAVSSALAPFPAVGVLP